MILNRFTTLPYLLSMLESGRLHFSDPTCWEDKNDSAIIESFRKRSGLSRVFALCFTKDTETIYHWKAFSHTESGCCVEFKFEELIKSISGDSSIRHSPVSYVKLNELKKRLIHLDQVPFTKRWPYRNESEYRIICESKLSLEGFSVPIERKMIKKITISQKLGSGAFSVVKEMIEKRYGISVNRSTVYENARWISHIESEI